MRQPDDHDTEEEAEVLASQMFSPTDMIGASEVLGSACGHGALAACLGISVTEATLLYFERGRSWVNMPDMERALVKSKAKWLFMGRKWPEAGLAILQWEGPWTRHGVPPRVACMHRHWVAVRNGFVWEDWLPKSAWEKLAQELMPNRATGYTVARGYEVAP